MESRVPELVRVVGERRSREEGQPVRGVVVREEGAALVDVHDVHPEDDAVPLDHLRQARRLQVDVMERRVRQRVQSTAYVLTKSGLVCRIA